MRDVLVTPPPATWGRGVDPFAGAHSQLEPPSKDEIIQAQGVEIRRLASELERLRITANTIANVAAFLIWKQTQDSPDPNQAAEIRVPLEFRTQFGKQIKLTAGQEGDELVARYSLRAPDHTWTGRAA